MKKLCLITPVILLIGIVSCQRPSESAGIAIPSRHFQEGDLQYPSAIQRLAPDDTTMAISIKVNMDTTVYYFIAWTSAMNDAGVNIPAEAGGCHLHSFSAIHTRKMMER